MDAVNLTYEKYQQTQILTRSIDGKLNRIWNDATKKDDVINHPAFKELSLMGTIIIPYIIHRMVKFGTSWNHIWLLEELTKTTPVLDEYKTNLNRQLSAWLLWFELSKFNNKKPYYGLID